MNAAPIRDGIEAMSCACNDISFSGSWDAEEISNGEVNVSGYVDCFDEKCDNVSSGVLASQSLVCYGTVTPLVTYQASLTFEVFGEGCVNVFVYIVPGRVYSYPIDSPLSLPFLRTNYYLMGNNSFAVVTNEKNVTVGQIQSDMVRVEYQNLSNVSVSVTVMSCLLLDTTMGESWEYDEFDIGILDEDGVTIHPVGLTNIMNVSANGNVKVCLSEMRLSELRTSLILIKRDEKFESARANTKWEENIVMTSGVLFCCGGVLVFVFHCFIPFNLAVFTAGIESFVLLSFRGVYFSRLYCGEITVGGLLDFGLIETPTFIYIGIF